ncbi:hypothetical protein N9376_01935 [Candidatus Pelagibacter sp.]|nr:hypothetical protein [Candidatus Pelagibacter sp.]
MTKINLFLFIDDKDLSIFLKRPRSYNIIFLSLQKYFSKCTVINISKIIGEKIKKNNFKKILNKDNIDYLCPSNSKELNYRINKNEKNYGFFKANFNLKYFKILRILNKSEIKLIQVNPYSFIFEDNTLSNKPIKDTIKIIFNLRLINYFHRIMCALGLYPKIHIHFDCDQKRIDLINSSLSKKIDNYFPVIKFSYYKKMIRINSKYYSDFIGLKKHKIEEKYITLLDEPLAHPDYTIREGIVDYKKKEVYYKNLVSLLKKIQKTFKKKVIVCLHPKAEYHHFKNFKLLQKNFKTVYYKTEYYISKSFLILNAISSTMNYAIIQNKPVFIIKSRHFANVANDKIKSIKKELNYPIINVDDFNKQNFKKLLDFKNKKKIDLYKQNRLFFEQNTSYLNQIINYLKDKD